MPKPRLLPKARKVRVLIAPREVAGVAAGLQSGLTARGLQVEMLFRWPHAFQYPVWAPASASLRLLWWLVALEHQPGGRFPKLRAGLSLAVRVALLPLIAARYTAVIYVGADTLLRGGIDRAVLRRLGVRTISVFCGSDSRPPYLNGYWVDPTDGDADLPAIQRATAATRDRVERAERDSDYVVNHPTNAQFHRQQYVNWTVLGMPSPATLAPVVGTQHRDGPVRVLHAPSDPRHKGTDQIRAAIAALTERGHAIEYTEITGQPHARVLELVEASDVVVDELYSDGLLAGLALEAARAGKPALVFGYAGELIRALAVRVGAPSAHYAHPDELIPQLELLISDRAHREKLGAELRDFVGRQWSTDAISERYERLIRGNPDPSWFDAPADWAYVHGWGIDERKLAAFLESYVARCGEDALELLPGSHLRAPLQQLMSGAAGP